VNFGGGSDTRTIIIDNEILCGNRYSKHIKYFVSTAENH
jgi:hypothetical protein